MASPSLEGKGGGGKKGNDSVFFVSKSTTRNRRKEGRPQGILVPAGDDHAVEQAPRVYHVCGDPTRRPQPPQSLRTQRVDRQGSAAAQIVVLLERGAGRKSTFARPTRATGGATREGSQGSSASHLIVLVGERRRVVRREPFVEENHLPRGPGQARERRQRRHKGTRRRATDRTVDP